MLYTVITSASLRGEECLNHLRFCHADRDLLETQRFGELSNLCFGQSAQLLLAVLAILVCVSLIEGDQFPCFSRAWHLVDVTPPSTIAYAQ